MKTLLKGTTASTVLLLFAIPASAEVDIDFQGEVNTFFGVVSQDVDPNERDHGIVNEADFDLILTGRADNGLIYGASMTVEASGGNAVFDESFLYVGGDWGEIRMGNHDGPADTLILAEPAAGSGGADGDYSAFANIGFAPASGFADSGNKISYHGDFEGFRFGVGFTPTQDGDAGPGGGPAMDSDNFFDDVVSVGAAYDGMAGGVSYGISAGTVYAFSDSATRKRLFEWGLGADIAYDGVRFGGYYINSGTSGFVKGATGTEDNWKAGLGLTYAMEALTVGTNARYEEEDSTGDGRITSWAAGVAADYLVAPGLLTYGDVTYFEYKDRDDAAPFDNDGVVFLVGTKVFF